MTVILPFQLYEWETLGAKHNTNDSWMKKHHIWTTRKDSFYLEKLTEITSMDN